MMRSTIVKSYREGRSLKAKHSNSRPRQNAKNDTETAPVLRRQCYRWRDVSPLCYRPLSTARVRSLKLDRTEQQEVRCRALEDSDDSSCSGASSASKSESLFENLHQSLSTEETFAAAICEEEVQTVTAAQVGIWARLKSLVLARRWTVVGLCFLAFMLCNMDRVNMSIAILPMAGEFGWDSTLKGIVQSSFFWGYLLTQILGGIWADKFGGKKILGFGVIWWSLATAFTPIAAHMGFPALLAARACMGIGEGVAMPAMNNLLSKWVPVQERSRSLAFVYSGMFVGSILGLAISPHIIQMLHWPSVFYIFGVLGLVWYVFWNQAASSSPQEDPFISSSERGYILSGKFIQTSTVKIPWKRLLSRIEVWTIIICHFCHNWGTFILLTWMPTYYYQVLGVDLMTSGFFSVLPWLTMAIAANIGGWIADSLVPKLGITKVRKIMQTIGFLGPAFFLTQLSRVETAPMAVLCMMCSQGLDAFSQSGLYSNHQDIGPKYAGVLLGLSNTAGVLAGVLGTYATGQILAHSSWDQVWHVAVAFYLIGAVVWNLFATGERVLD